MELINLMNTSQESYYIKVKGFDGGIQTFWGKDLERLVKESNLQDGQCVYIAKISDKDMGNGKFMAEYDMRALEKTTEQVKNIKQKHILKNDNNTLKFKNTVIGQVIDSGTRTINGEKKSFVKLETIHGQTRTYWYKDLNVVTDNLKKGETIFFSQIKEQQLEREIKQDKFNASVVGNDLDKRAVSLIKQQAIENSQNLDLGR